MKRGVPVALLTTDRFDTLAESEVMARGAEDLPRIVVPHPSESDTGVQVEEATMTILEGLRAAMETYSS